MIRNQKDISINNFVLSILIFLNVVILKTANTMDEKWYWALLISIPLLFIAFRSGR